MTTVRPSLVPFAIGVGFGICVAAFIFGLNSYTRRTLPSNSDSEEEKKTEPGKVTSAVPATPARQETDHERYERLKHVPLGRLWTPRLNTSAIQKWRSEYRNFRIGLHAGAGNDPDLDEEAEEQLPQIRAPSPTTISPQVKLKPIFEVTSTADEMEATFNTILDYRLAYLNHRRGAAHGAKGLTSTFSVMQELHPVLSPASGEIKDLLKNLTKSQLRLLPASQIANLRTARTKMEESKKSYIEKTATKPPKAHVTPLHVHFGAGRLGSGLIIPSIARSDVPFVIVQRPTKDFEPLIEAALKGDKLIEMTNNGNSYSNNKLLVVTQESDLPDAWKAWIRGPSTKDLPRPDPRGLLLYCDSKSTVAGLIYSNASSFSTSVGPGLKFLPSMLNESIIPKSEPEHQPALFAGENDHAAVAKLKRELAGRVEVVPLMVDRICTDRVLLPEKMTIDTQTEPYEGSIVVLTPPVHVAAPPFVGDHVLIPRMDVEAAYLCRRKLLMVNGMHTTLAFLTLDKLVPTQDLVELDNDKLRAPYSDYKLVTLESADEEQRNNIRAWAVARLLLLAYESEFEVIKSAHGVTTVEEVLDILWKYSEQTLSRFNTIDDSAGRVLAGGVTNRYKGRLAPVDQFLSKQHQRNPLMAKILERSGFESKQLSSLIKSLTRSAFRFTEIDIKLDLE